MDNLICFCFGYSVDDLRQDYRKNGRSTLIENHSNEIILHRTGDDLKNDLSDSLEKLAMGFPMAASE